MKTLRFRTLTDLHLVSLARSGRPELELCSVPELHSAQVCWTSATGRASYEVLVHESGPLNDCSESSLSVVEASAPDLRALCPPHPQPTSPPQGKD